MNSIRVSILLLWNTIALAAAFTPSIKTTTSFISSLQQQQQYHHRHHHTHLSTSSSSSDDNIDTTKQEKLAQEVTGEELEIMLTEWEQPLILDAYATWCGPCLLMAPEFEAAAQELKGKVRFVKLDTDKEPQMANSLGVNGLPTLMFLDKFDPQEMKELVEQEEGGDDGEEEEDSGPRAVLKARIEGAIQKDSIVALCDHHFFGGPLPEQL